jgi:hypothetical protein
MGQAAPAFLCAMLVSEWRCELANVFALFRERSFQIDTIPKPGGLGFESALRVVAVQLLSRIRPGFAHLLPGPVLCVGVVRWRSSYTPPPWSTNSIPYSTPSLGEARKRHARLLANAGQAMLND